MKTSILALLLAPCLSLSLPAQASLPVYKAVTPKHAGVFKVASGEFVPANSYERGTYHAVIFNASELTNYYAAPGADQEWLDEGMLLTRYDGPKAQEQVHYFEFIYCSTEPDPNQNSGAITIAFYDEILVCSGPTNGGNLAQGGYVCAYDIVGLPLGDPNGGLACWIVDVDLSRGFECPSHLEFQSCYQGMMTPDEASGKLFGWSFTPRNDNTGPWLSNGGTQAAGIDNSFVWFDQFGALVGCFWFGGTPWANFAMKMTGADMASCRTYYPCSPVQSPASDNLYLTASRPFIGQRDFTLYNSSGSSISGWLIAGFAPAEISTISGTLLATNILSPSPVPIASGGSIYNLYQVIGQYLYFQSVTTANGAPPSTANIPDNWSNGWCDYIN